VKVVEGGEVGRSDGTNRRKEKARKPKKSQEQLEYLEACSA
jgi:hypothetical protein